jgi:vacuolar-type H+-ATPase subunit E/Vma4
MTTPNIKEGLEGIANEVLSDIQKEAETLILQAQKEAKEILKAAKVESDKIYTMILSETMAKASLEKRKIESTADVEARNRFLQVKEEIVELSFVKAQEKLNEFVQDEDEYFDFLVRSIEEAAVKIGEEQLIVQVNSRDKDWLSKGNLNSLSKKLNLSFELAVETLSCIGGSKVQAIDGKLVYDNTLENRFHLLKPTLRIEAAKILFQKEGS